MCIVHTSTFSTLKIHKIFYAYQTGMKLAAIATIPLLVQQISDHDVFPIMCYEPLNVQNRMCELCTFSQIRSQLIKCIRSMCDLPISIGTKL